MLQLVRSGGVLNRSIAKTEACTLNRSLHNPTNIDNHSQTTFHLLYLNILHDRFDVISILFNPAELFGVELIEVMDYVLPMENKT